jgi:hypothetical protein
MCIGRTARTAWVAGLWSILLVHPVALHAQGTAADYERSQTLVERLGGLVAG